jgi:tRNA G18 (ribose-2'-O)-methylase SpoU
LQALLDNVRSLNNVGAIFRSADGVGLDHLYLSGFSPTPAHPKLAKTSLGAETRVPWSTHADAVELASRLRDQGARLWALEGGPLSSPFYDALHDLPQDNAPLVLILGHEVSGVDPHLLRLCDRVVRLPMHGLKGSLNVAVAFGVAAYTLAYAGHLCGNVPLEITGR